MNITEAIAELESSTFKDDRDNPLKDSLALAVLKEHARRMENPFVWMTDAERLRLAALHDRIHTEEPVPEDSADLNDISFILRFSAALLKYCGIGREAPVDFDDRSPNIP